MGVSVICSRRYNFEPKMALAKKLARQNNCADLLRIAFSPLPDIMARIYPTQEIRRLTHLLTPRGNVAIIVPAGISAVIPASPIPTKAVSPLTVWILDATNLPVRERARQNPRAGASSLFRYGRCPFRQNVMRKFPPRGARQLAMEYHVKNYASALNIAGRHRK